MRIYIPQFVLGLLLVSGSLANAEVLRGVMAINGAEMK